MLKKGDKVICKHNHVLVEHKAHGAPRERAIMRGTIGKVVSVYHDKSADIIRYTIHWGHIASHYEPHEIEKKK